jgi:hypothetical protein
MAELIAVELPDGRTAWARGVIDGLPVFGWGQVPSGLVTFRQLAEQGLRPGGADPMALLAWRRRGCGRQLAALWPIEIAVEKRVPTSAQLAALDRALAARRVCRICGPVDHYTRGGLCSHCFLTSDNDDSSRSAAA